MKLAYFEIPTGGRELLVAYGLVFLGAIVLSGIANWINRFSIMKRRITAIAVMLGTIMGAFYYAGRTAHRVDVRPWPKA